MTTVCAPGAAGENFGDAVAYERFMGRWSRRLAPAFLDFAEIGNPEAALDLGCGTGALCDALHAMLPVCRIAGADLSAVYLQACRARLPSPPFSFDRVDAANLPYADDRFDASLSSLLLMLVPQPAKVAAEMWRVTRRRGIAAACTWPATGQTMIDLLWDEATAMDPQAPADAGRSVCAEPGVLSELWQAAGFASIRETVLSCTLRFQSFDDFWLPMAAGVGPAGRYVSDLPADVRAALRERLRQRLAACAGTDGQFALEARALAVRGMKP